MDSGWAQLLAGEHRTLPDDAPPPHPSPHIAQIEVDRVAVRRRKPLRADAQRNREALLAKAREVIDAGTFLDLRHDDFARLAGVGVGTLYRRFPTREALVAAVCREEVAALCDRARRLRATMPAEEALTAFLRGRVDQWVPVPS
ncbi:TetR/AcrR family transcriptional regulator [Nonomuraea mesophila]|uniref:TetR/AcrR family transcriptional regulator n=1 Tax=Nonomuraea mesophila TaxID=2530382 RepID=UPI001FEB4D18|nr:TetR/AcrR family transcriptional regulator [Nonomuraea mesophila]